MTIPSPSPGTQGWGAAGAGGGRTLPGRVLVRPRPGRPGVEGAALTLGAAGSPRRRVSLLHPRSGSRTAEPNAANKRTRCTKVGAGRRAEWGAGEAAPRLRGECAAFLPRVFPCRRYPGHRQPPGRLQGGMFIFLNVPITGRNYNREKQFSERKQMHIWCPSTTFQQHSMLGLCHIPSIGSGPLMAHLKGYIFSRLYFINGHHWTL